MTEKDYIKEQLNLLKIIMTGAFGGMIGIFVYNAQTSGSNIVFMAFPLIILCILFWALGKLYIRVLNELKALP